MQPPFVYIVIVNWNRWDYTIRCLESIFRCDYPAYRVIVCDNNSSDDSVAHLKAWAEGHLDATVPIGELAHLVAPPCRKPIPCDICDESSLFAGIGVRDHTQDFLIVRAARNHGFAGGNNVALRYAMARNDFDYVWLLNNDTVVAADALSHLVRRAQSDPKAGMCGSTITYFDSPNVIQTLGGCTYYPCLGRARQIGHLKSVQGPINSAEVERRLSYVNGASMLVSQDFLSEIGLMDENYFLFNEEIDWATRARGRYRSAYAPLSKVYHHKGATTSSGRVASKRGMISSYFLWSSRLKFTKKHYPNFLILIWFQLIAELVVQFVRCRKSMVSVLISVIRKRDGVMISHLNNAQNGRTSPKTADF